MPNNENEVFRSYRLHELSPSELLVHGHTEMMSKFFVKYLLPLIEKKAQSDTSLNRITALELGGATCYGSYYLKRKMKNIEIIASDISPYVLSVSKIFPSLFQVRLDEFCACDTQCLPFRENTFDIIFGTEFLHHCECLDAATREIARVLRPKGLFFGIEPMCGRITKPIIMVLSGAKSRTLNECVIENRYTYSQWATTFKKAGLEISLSAIDDPKIYKAMIGKKCTPSSFKGRYLTKYVYSKFFTMIPHPLQRKTPNATLRILAAKKKLQITRKG